MKVLLPIEQIKKQWSTVIERLKLVAQEKKMKPTNISVVQLLLADEMEGVDDSVLFARSRAHQIIKHVPTFERMQKYYIKAAELLNEKTPLFFLKNLFEEDKPYFSLNEIKSTVVNEPQAIINIAKNANQEAYNDLHLEEAVKLTLVRTTENNLMLKRLINPKK